MQFEPGRGGKQCVHATVQVAKRDRWQKEAQRNLPGSFTASRTDCNGAEGISREAQVSKQNAPNSIDPVDEPKPLLPANLEPFVEFSGHQSFGRASDTFGFGYRC